MPLQPYHLGCVSYLNSKPLIEPLVGDPRVQITFAVPADLLGLMDEGSIGAGLLSIVDYQRSRHDLVLLPAGMIGCFGETLTVRLFSRVEPGHIRTLHADTDSHTSVILARLILAQRHGARPEIIPLDAAKAGESTCDALLLIGDKVVANAPDAAVYPHQFDLGEQWKVLTGLPFVFAMWMGRPEMVDAELCALLSTARQTGETWTDRLVAQYAAGRKWPPELLRKYFTRYLRYGVDASARAGLAAFFKMATELGFLTGKRPIRYLGE